MQQASLVLTWLTSKWGQSSDLSASRRPPLKSVVRISRPGPAIALPSSVSEPAPVRSWAWLPPIMAEAASSMIRFTYSTWS